MKKRLYILLAIVAMAVGCSESDIPTPGAGGSEYNAIHFSESPDNWGDTRGVELDASNFTNMQVYAYYTGEQNWAGVAKEDIAPIMENQAVTKQKSGGWSYSPTRYWSSNEIDKYSFFAFSPSDAIAVTYNANNKPVFNYTLQPSADDNDDLLAAVQYNKQKSETIIMPFKHALTRISLQAKLSGAIPTNANETEVRYMVSSVEFHGIRRRGKINFKVNGSFSWVLTGDEADTITCTATQGKTLLSHISTIDEPELTTEPKDICKEGKAIFILPQNVSNAYINLNIVKSYKDKSGTLQQTTYEIKNCAVPTDPDTPNEFVAGQSITMIFTYDISDTSGDKGDIRDDKLNNGESGNVIFVDKNATNSDNASVPVYEKAEDIADRAADIIAEGYSTIYINGGYSNTKYFQGGKVNGKSVFDLINERIPADATYSIVLEDLGNNCKDLLGDLKNYYFKGNTHIVSLTLPGGENFAKIDESAFEGCTNLKQVIIGSADDLTKIDCINPNAFRGCTALESVTIYSNKDKISYESSSFAASGLASKYKNGDLTINNNVGEFSK